MNIAKLEKKLKEKGIPKELYSILEGGLPNEQYCIVKEELWYVYYSERGRRSGLKEFELESDACEYFYDILKQYSR